jgi:hypothetical protein
MSFNERLTAAEQQLKTCPFYNPSARAQVAKGYNLFLTGDFLYWKATENGLTYAVSSNNPDGTLSTTHLKLFEPHFRYDYGFKVGAGFNIGHDAWDLYANWTHFYTGAHAHKHAKSGEGLYPVWAFPSGPLSGLTVQEAQEHWKLFLSLLDVELGKEYYVGKHLSLRPHLDIRTAWINQDFNCEYNRAVSGFVTFDDRVEMKNDYWGVGPRLGLDSQWWLGAGFSFYGKAAFSLIYGPYSIKQEEKAETLSKKLVFHREMHIARAITDLGLYFAWDHMFFDNSYHFGVMGGWEQHLFFEQNQLFRFLDPLFQGSLLSNQGDLTLQGWTLSARIDF